MMHGLMHGGGLGVCQTTLDMLAEVSETKHRALSALAECKNLTCMMIVLYRIVTLERHGHGHYVHSINTPLPY